MKYSKNNSSKKNNRLKNIALVLCMIPSMAVAQKDIIVFHNCENLFYPLNDSLTEDDEYTLEGKKHWTFKKYKTKLNELAKTYISIDKNNMPSIIGLSEIENNTVLNALTMDTPLRKVGYKYIHYSSNDIRGIDVALIYNPKRFSVQESKVITAPIQKEEDRTRDVLYVKGKLGEILVNIYVVHAPSRREKNIKKHLRQEIFSLVYSHIDSLMTKGEKNFIVMGDMNDNPWDETIKDGFKTKAHTNNPNPLLINLMQENKGKTGSYVYNGEYLSFDQFLVSESIKEKIVFNDNFNESFIFKPDFLIDKNNKSHLDVPFSTYKGMHYQGGISDHFPIIMMIKE